MPTLLTQLKQQVITGLKRASITNCARWAEMYRVMGQPIVGPWRFDHHPWLYEMHMCETPMMVGMKSAQMGYTETALNKTFYKIDVHGISTLYVLPASEPDASDFSTSRFDTALELSPHLRTMFSDVKNIKHKRAGSANLFIRGSRSRSQMKSIPVGQLIFDEVDEMNQSNITLAMERVSGQVAYQIFLLSTPTIERHGIHRFWSISTQEHYVFKCPHCDRYTELSWPDSFVAVGETETDPRIAESYIRCTQCKMKLDHEAKLEYLKNKEAGGTGHWVPTYHDRAVRGFHVSQLYSTVRPIADFAIKYIAAQRNPVDEQEFFNSKLGLTHTVSQARITDEDFVKCLGTHRTKRVASSNELVTMGIDVGKMFHYEVASWKRGPDSTLIPVVLAADKVADVSDLIQIVKQYYPKSIVIDAQPERRLSADFCRLLFPIAHACFYTKGVAKREITVNDDESIISVDRTSWMDEALGRFHNQTIMLPMDISIEYRDQVKTPTRIYERDTDGNPTGRYITPVNELDHYAHARTYNEIAFRLASSIGKSQNITKEY